VNVDLFSGQGWHNILNFFLILPERPFAVAGEFVGGGPDPRFRGFRADTLFCLAGFCRFRLLFLFACIAGFIVLRHCCASLGLGRFFGRQA
jgi:hypothetical protein